MQTSAVPSVDGHDVLTKSDKVLIVRSRRQRHRTPRGQLMLRTIRKFPRNRDSAWGIVFPNHVAVPTNTTSANVTSSGYMQASDMRCAIACNR